MKPITIGFIIYTFEKFVNAYLVCVPLIVTCTLRLGVLHAMLLAFFLSPQVVTIKSLSPLATVFNKSLERCNSHVKAFLKISLSYKI